ncbi:MAG: hypothetical protein K0S33_1964 [Bacteroidetes bacterium]|jgi:hypothetical protein|nr:hypothetical protein [Bacteroidota bacterium]
MRYLKLLYLSVAIAISTNSYSQTGLEADDSMSVVYNSPMFSGSQLYWNVYVDNTTSTAYSDTITYIAAIDTFGTGGSQLTPIKTTWTIVNNYNPGGTVLYTDSINLTINVNCRGGINTVVIWPVASDMMMMTFPTVDSIFADVLVLEAPTGLRTIQKGTIRVGPNPFSDKISLILPPKISLEQVRIKDISGRLVYESGQGTKSWIDTSSLLPGIYFVEISLSDGSATIIKTIKQ